MKKSGFALAALLCIAAPLAAADEFAAYQKASAELAALAQPARSASPEAAPLFAIVSDSKRFLDNRSFSQGDLGQLKEMCKAAVEQANRYVTHDVQKAGTAAASADLKAVAEARWAQSDRNIRLYQDELGLLFPFTVRCNARVVSLSESKFASLKKEEVTEESINGAREIQKTAFDNIKSSIVLISNKQLSEANSLRVGRAALETAQAYMSVLPLSEREKLKGVEVSAELNSAMNEELKLSDAEAAILAQLNTAMWEKNCSAMCMVSLPNSSPFLPYLEAAKQLQATQPVTRLSTPPRRRLADHTERPSAFPGRRRGRPVKAGRVGEGLRSHQDRHGRLQQSRLCSLRQGHQGG